MQLMLKIINMILLILFLYVVVLEVDRMCESGQPALILYLH